MIEKKISPYCPFKENNEQDQKNSNEGLKTTNNNTV